MTYAHKVIEDLTEQFNRVHTRGEAFSPEVTYIGSTIQNIYKAEKFHLGEAYEFATPFRELLKRERIEAFMGDMSEGIRLPYPLCWFDYRVDEGEIAEGNTAAPYRAWLARELTPIASRWLAFNYYSDAGTWVVNPVGYLILFNRTFGSLSVDEIRAINEASGTTMNFSKIRMESNFTATIPEDLMDKMTDIPIEELLMSDSEDIGMANMALVMLNCKNIVTKVVKPPRKLNKKRNKSGKTPISEYKVLRVKLPAKRVKGGRSSGGERLTKLHMVRGHPKIFTKEAPLFGKYTGIYWWSPMLRGDADQGTVDKEYKLEV